MKKLVKKPKNKKLYLVSLYAGEGGTNTQCYVCGR